MPITVRVDSAQNLMLYTATGRWDPQEVMRVLQQVQDLLDRKRPVLVFWDLTEVQESLAGSDDVVHTAEMMNRQGAALRSSGRTAVLVGNQLQFGLVRMYQGWLHSHLPWTTEVFHDRRQALDWLGVTEPPIPA